MKIFTVLMVMSLSLGAIAAEKVVSKIEAKSLSIKKVARGSKLLLNESGSGAQRLKWVNEGDGWYCRGTFGYRPRDICLGKIGEPCVE